ncbi:MAG: hypothetical protein ACR2FS_03960, partial [Phormidesmis sp.]
MEGTLGLENFSAGPMAVPDFNTTLQLFRDWSKRGASLEEIQAAILLQQEGGASAADVASGIDNSADINSILTVLNALGLE